MSGVFAPLEDSQSFNDIITSLNAGESGAIIYGLADSQKAYLMSALGQRTRKSLLVVAADSLHAKKLYDDISLFGPKGKVGLFPAEEVMPYEIVARSLDISAQRIEVLWGLTHGSMRIVVTQASALFSKLTPASVFTSMTLRFAVGERINLSEVVKKLVNLGYERVDMVEGKAQFSLRGGILDVFPLITDNPYRIELFDDEIDSIRVFEVVDQRSTKKVESITVAPAREMVLTDAAWRHGRQRVYQELKERENAFLKIGKPAEAQNLRCKVEAHLEKIGQRIYFEGIERYISHFYDNLAILQDYFYERPLVMLDEPGRLKDAFTSTLSESHEAYKQLLEKGEILASQSNIYFDAGELINKLIKSQNIQFCMLPRAVYEFNPTKTISFTARDVDPLSLKPEMLTESLKSYKRRGYRTVLLAGTHERAKRLKSNLQEMGLMVSTTDLEHVDLAPGSVMIAEGTINKGFELPDVKLALVSDHEIFGRPKRKTQPARRRESTRKLTEFLDIKPGDYVVHTTHGIGKYLGVETLEVEGRFRDYLSVSYAGGDKLYIPSEQMDLIQKYIGEEGKAPKLSRLGGNEWNRVKARAKESVKQMAEELIQLYAARQALPGYAFSPDTPWQKQFEDQFPFEETPDQLAAIEDVKRDMESSVPMDRLLCGDVGYGKTEVALRAAFKAIMDGKQVCVLAPTTILAQQHYNTFKDRFSAFPINIDLLSRFRTASEQKRTISGLKQGAVDIVIGTHRLLGRDTKFKDLGLLIIDEEQRFGVAQKEKIKRIKKNVDVLTMTATPIPRTLHMAVTGVRDMSIIETPPEDRYPVQTYVVEYNESLIRDAILREMSRGGQIFYVHNRVETIDQEAQRLSDIVPEARIITAHGRMGETELESVMMDFYNSEYDVLVCSTIIETGLDIPNVNTLIITHADRLGLSQLYQLRGRVGRSNRLAYAYITYAKDKVLSEVAEKRLSTIREFTEFGSGFKIALRDLEIRGAGNLLGSQQHGHMEAVGYELYCRMLEETINEFKGKAVQDKQEPVIELKVDAYIDDGYVGTPEKKFEFYKKIAGAETLQEVYDIEDEMEDRFGTIPQPARTLVSIARIKAYARTLKISSISQKGDKVVLSFADKNAVPGEVVIRVLQRFSRRLKITATEVPYLTLDCRNLCGYELVDRIVKILETFHAFSSEKAVV
jgi:transcription-repair coupling factor (superfamily II helicase)